MSDSRVRARESQSQELADLQTQFSKKKKELAAQQEKDLAATKNYYNERIATAQDQGQAAVSHIKKQTKQEKAALNEQVTQTRETVDNNLKEILRQEQAKRHRIAGETEKASKSLSQNQQVAERRAYEDISKISEKASKERIKTTEKSKAELQRIQDSYQKEIQNAQNTREEAIQREKNRANTDLARIRNQNENLLTKEKAQGEVGIVRVQDRAQEEVKRQQAISDAQIEKVQTDAQVKTKRETERGEVQRQKIASTYQRQVDQITNLGEKRLAETTDKHSRMETRLEEQHARELESDKKQFESRQQDQSSAYRNQTDRNNTAYKNNLDRQREQFNSKYLNTQKNNETSLSIQRDMYARELNELKQELSAKVDSYESKRNDPFYKVKDLGTRFVETPTSYILKTQVPEHEINNIKVRIQDDQATITGQRAFQDRVAQDNKIMSTSSNESFKEIYKFEQPVAVKAVLQERDGDYLTVTIPKMVSGMKTKA